MSNERAFGSLMFLVLAVSLCMALECFGGERASVESFWNDIKSDHSYFYSTTTTEEYALALLLGGIVANSDLDEKWFDSYQSSFVDEKNPKNFSDFVKSFGAGQITVPVYAGAALLGGLGDEYRSCEVIGEWGASSLRSIIVGAPVLLASQRILGASRPSDGDGSNWRFMNDNNGVSGHAFMGAIPFLVAADMSDNYFWKTAMYASSFLCGISRIHDMDHYPSQVFLGWSLAYIAESSIRKTNKEKKNAGQISLIMMNGEPLLAYSRSY